MTILAPFEGDETQHRTTIPCFHLGVRDWLSGCDLTLLLCSLLKSKKGFTMTISTNTARSGKLRNSVAALSSGSDQSSTATRLH